MNDINLIKSLIRLVGQNVGALEKTEMSCCDVTISQCNAILEIGMAEGISLVELAEMLNLDKSTVSRTINGLVDQGYVTRLTDDENRRYVRIELTDKGHEIYEKIGFVLSNFCSDVIKSIPEEKREQVMESLMLLIKAFNENKCC